MVKIPQYKQASELLTQSEKIGQFFMPAAFINDTEAEIQHLEHQIRTLGIGGICFFHSRASAATNFEGKKKVIYNDKSLTTLKRLIKRYQACARYPLLISIDAEWGLAMRIEETPQYPYAITLGAMNQQEELIYEVGKRIAQDCLHAGIHWNFAPVVDINSNPNNPVIGYRSFGSNKHKVLAASKAFLKGAQSQGILSCIKHFPGHGDTATDSHLGMPIIDKSEIEVFNEELFPFKALIKEGVEAVMVGHLAIPALTNGEAIPATISARIIKGTLRKTLGFKGLVVSDALNMHAISKLFPENGDLEWTAFDAGNDILCFTENCEAGIHKIMQNATPAQIEDSFERVWRLKEKINKQQRPSELSNVAEIQKTVALNSLTLLKGDETTVNTISSKKFVGLSIGKNTENYFFQEISNTIDFPKLHFNNENGDACQAAITSTDNLVIALYPRHIKPNNKFGLSDQEIQFLNKTTATKNVILYLFGNPYCVQHIGIETLESCVLVYQDFKAFQQNAAQHFLGKIKAKGIVPVNLI